MNPARRDPVALSLARIPHVEEYYDRLGYEIDPLGAYRLRPNQRLPHVTINHQGYRGAPFTGEETVLLLGDSVSFGVGASGDDKTFARFLEAVSGERVADASVRAYRVFQHFLQLPRLLDLLPRIRHVLVWCGYADLTYWVTTGGCVHGAFQFEWKYQRLRLPRVLALLQRGLVGKPQAFVRETGTVEDLASHVAAYLRGIHDVCAGRHIGMTLLIQPFVRSRPTGGALQEIVDLCDAKTLVKCGQGWYEVAPRFVEELQAALTGREASACVDCQALVSEDDFFDQAHLSEAALCRLAQRLVHEHRLLDLQRAPASGWSAP